MRTTLAESRECLAVDGSYGLTADGENKIYNTWIVGHLMHGSEVLHVSPRHQIC